MIRSVRSAALAAVLLSCGWTVAAPASESADPNDRAASATGEGVAEVSARRPVPRPADAPSFAAIHYDDEWLAQRPKASGDASWQCLTEALYFEARGEEPKGQFAVAEVILNRVDSRAFPGNVCAVVKQGTGRKWRCQFTYTCDGIPETVRDRRSWAKMGKIARLALDGAPRELTRGALYYHTRAVSPSWSRVFARTATIGAHHFYTPETQLAMN